MQHRPARVILERHAAELEHAARALERSRVGPLGHLGLLVEQRERPLGAGEVGLERRGLLADRLQRIVELSQVGQRHQQLPERQDVRPDVLHADEQDRAGAERRRDPDEQPVASLHECHADARRHPLARALGKPIGLPRFPAERLDDAQGAERLLHDRQRGGLELLDLAMLPPHTRAVQARQRDERRGDRECHERQLPVELGRNDDHRPQRDRCRDEGDDALHHDLVDHRGVLLNAIQRVGRALGIVVR